MGWRIIACSLPRLQTDSRVLLLCAMLALLVPGAAARELTVAVAANFLPAARALAAGFERSAGHRVKLVSGSTGKLYTQIIHGAPYDVFLAADVARPLRLEREARAVPDSRFTYALGRLVLWSATPGRDADALLELLQSSAYRRIAMANPKLAPYGRAAVQTLKSIRLWEQSVPRQVLGENVAQAWAMVATGNAELGLVAASLLRESEHPAASQYWPVPASYHEPIRQDAVLTLRGGANPAAVAFHGFLRSDTARALIRASGYDLP